MNARLDEKNAESPRQASGTCLCFLAWPDLRKRQKEGCLFPYFFSMIALILAAASFNAASALASPVSAL